MWLKGNVCGFVAGQNCGQTAETPGQVTVSNVYEVKQRQKKKRHRNLE